MNIYDVAPEFSHCCMFYGKMYFAKAEAVPELEKMGIRVFVRKNWCDIFEV